MNLAKLLSTFLLLMICEGVFAALDLELTQGISGAIPIAVVPFDSEDKLPAALTNIITADLKYSGRFRVLSPGEYRQRPHSADQINMNDWSYRNVDNLLVGKVKELDGGRYQVTVQLVDLYGAKNPDSKATTLFSKTYILEHGQERRLSHYISDSIYYQLTGKRGIFSTHIAYILEKRAGKNRRYQLMIADVDGYNSQPLLSSVEPIMSPSWSPDGKKIAYVSFEHHRAGIYIQDITTGSRQLLSQYSGINGAPAWSPDGKQLAIVLSKSEHPKIYTLDVATKTLRQITDGYSIDTEPSWAPDGQSLVFTSNRSGGPQIYQVSLASKQVKRLTFDGSYNASASFFKDGQGLILLHHEDGLYSVAKLEFNGNGRIETLTDSGRDQSPSIAPNDEMVLFATRLGSRQVLGMVSSDAKIRLRLPAQEGEVREPDWSPV